MACWCWPLLVALRESSWCLHRLFLIYRAKLTKPGKWWFQGHGGMLGNIVGFPPLCCLVVGVSSLKQVHCWEPVGREPLEDTLLNLRSSVLYKSGKRDTTKAAAVLPKGYQSFWQGQILVRQDPAILACGPWWPGTREWLVSLEMHLPVLTCTSGSSLLP
ncbi:hypothetical protein MAPG_01403 [Magnaporthiopsis poae ATCC 64411]|uniref:Uncharacterized protein n=1 Tax=Magnaporthiopsis poae (strain ATCC 64411 / 73-15) TaxID=644358 RepID=A0A0C4DNL1_MAGP6|nr:hypothetical protein MAPG_01403 [Magnaporthiopsis poae ATCC 64411]